MHGHRPEVSVVVATLNRAGRLERLLDALRAQTLDPARFEVVIVDDGSTDATADVLRRTREQGTPTLRTIPHLRNEGRAQAREDGWRIAATDLVAFTDDDCLPHPRWLEAGLAASQAHPGAIVQGRTDPDPTELEGLGPFSRTVSVPAYDPAFQTCNIFYPRAALELVGGFDVAAFGRVHGGEDSDLAWRAIKAGVAAVFAPDALVHHAVNDLGPIGKLRFSAGWSLLAYARHRELRQAHFVSRFFWKRTHLWLTRAVAGIALRRLPWPVRLWLALPWLRSLYARGKLDGGGPALAPFYAACDVAEVWAALRNTVAHRRLML